MIRAASGAEEDACLAGALRLRCSQKGGKWRAGQDGIDDSSFVEEMCPVPTGASGLCAMGMW
jgi:hypothetical protein